MKRRNFLKSTITLGSAAATAGLTACSADHTECVASDSAIDPLAGFTNLGKIQAKSSDQIEHSYWGIQAGAYDEQTLATARALGVHWTRVLAGWAGVEREKGQYNWSKLDTAIDSLLKFKY